ncbi:MAG TPA: peptide ABC transporter substrate-binding protein [Gemmatimonadaceae bacterium]|nr:peptide ABC transporter substrate-binding protein [Gemmatimonadaceae bacterium]
MAAMKRVRLLCIVLLCACVGSESSSDKPGGGTLVITSGGGDPDILVPSLLSTVQAAEISDMIYERLADIGDSLNTVTDRGFTPRLADRWTWSPDSLSIAFHINSAAKWHDGTPVRSSDVRFTFQSSTDSTLGSGVKGLVSGIDSVTTPDSATAVFWFHARTPQQFYDATYQMPIMPEHIWKNIAPSAWRGSEPAKHPVGSAQYRFVRWIPGAVVELAADTANYRGTPKLRRLIWSIAPDFNTAVTRFLSGETDFFEVLRRENLPDVAKHPQLRTKQYRGLSYIFAQFNLRDPVDHARPHPLFGNPELRRALTMATNRAAIVRSVYDSLALPAIGPTVRAYPTTDQNLAQIPFDLPRARQILDSLGWHLNADGVRERKGRLLRFSLLAPSKGPRVQLAVVLQEQLRQAGAKVEIEQLEFPVLVERERKRAFDAAIGQWNTQPSPGSVRGSWGTSGSRASSGTNYSSYENPVFDAYVDSALASFDLARAKAYFTKAYETIIQDAPAIWLAEPVPTVGYHSRLQLAALRSDAWWAHIPEWWIPPDKRIPRDNAPGPTTSAPAESAAKKTP